MLYASARRRPPLDRQLLQIFEVATGCSVVFHKWNTLRVAARWGAEALIWTWTLRGRLRTIQDRSLYLGAVVDAAGRILLVVLIVKSLT